VDINSEIIKSCFLGLAIGDALGVPVEFRDRSFFKDYPVTGMLGYGSWNQPPGTWSDDSSLTFCLAESLLTGYNLRDIGQKFVRWYKEGYWGARYKVFDIGETTRLSVERIATGENPLYSGALDEYSNGNGSLMRIAPAALYFYNLPNNELYQRIKEISSITHAHFRSVFSCFIFSKYLIEIFAGTEKRAAFINTISRVKRYANHHAFNQNELKLFESILEPGLEFQDENSIESHGYVLATLQASLWCFLTTNTFSEAVLKAVNLGDDTDTTACVTGALAGLYYGQSAIPSAWRKTLAREQDIVMLADDFTKCLKVK
jgi:ADP-ribosylglycohydrolase